MNHARLSTNLALLACLTAAQVANAQDSSPATTNWMRDFVRLRTMAFTQKNSPWQLGSGVEINRIIGGGRVPSTVHPFQVALLWKDIPDNAKAQFCGGTLIKPNIVVTAAHCSDVINAQQVQVLTGTRSLTSGGTRRNVTSIVVHPDWTGSTHNNDVAVWRLSTNAVGIPLATLASADRSVGSGLFTSGWGDTESGSGEGSPELRGALVVLVSRTNCNDANSYDGRITTEMICAGWDQGGKDSCQGDSGGPLTTFASGRTELTGITSWGWGCAKPNLVGVYTRVSSPTIRNFILSNS